MSDKEKLNIILVPPDKKAINYLFDQIDSEFIKKVVAELNKTDFQSVDFKQVQEVIDLLMEGFSVRLMGLRPPSLFRARKGDRNISFESLNELWYPPKEFVGIGRLNKAKESVFYCSDDQNVALLEVRPIPGDKVTILQCIIKEDYHLRLLPIGIQQYLRSKQPEFEKVQFEDELLEHTFSKKEDFEKNRLIHDYFVSQLTKLVDSEKQFEYHPTVAMSINYLNPLNNIDGVLYPSVASKFKGKNIALKTEIADKFLLPIAAWEYLVEKEIEPLTYQCICLNSSNEIMKGKIIWE
ncbi:MAG: RES domain-containing protein [Bacteroidales bacterium]|nr:RES domain-containing protein [Bacteroidales bacterium]